MSRCSSENPLCPPPVPVFVRSDAFKSAERDSFFTR